MHKVVQTAITEIKVFKFVFIMFNYFLRKCPCVLTHFPFLKALHNFKGPKGS